MPINSARRKQLDDLVTQMDGSGASSDEIQAVVNDFTGKYGNETEPVKPPAAPQESLATSGINAIPGILNKATQAYERAKVGVAKGAADTAVSLGELMHKIPGVSSAVDAAYGTPGLSKASFPVAHEELKAQGNAEKVGKGAEQVGEFFIPGLAEGPQNIGRIGKALLEGAKTAGVTGAQTAGDPKAMAVSAGLGTLGGVLGQTLEAVPGMIRRGIGVKVADPRTASAAKAAGDTIDDPQWLAARGINRQMVADLIKKYGLTGGEGDLATISGAPANHQELLSAAHSAMDPEKRSLGHIWSLLAAGSGLIPGVGIGGHMAVAGPLAALSMANKYPGYMAKGVDAALPVFKGGVRAAAGLVGDTAKQRDPMIDELLARQGQ